MTDIKNPAPETRPEPTAWLWEHPTLAAKVYFWKPSADHANNGWRCKPLFAELDDADVFEKSHSSNTPPQHIVSDDSPRYSMKRMRHEKARALDYGWRHALQAAASAACSVSENWIENGNPDLQTAIGQVITAINSLQSSHAPTPQDRGES